MKAVVVFGLVGFIASIFFNRVAFAQPSINSFFFQYGYIDAVSAALSSVVVRDSTPSLSRENPFLTPKNFNGSITNVIYHGGITGHRLAASIPNYKIPIAYVTLINYGIQGQRYDAEGFPAGIYNAWEGEAGFALFLDTIGTIRGASTPRILLTQIDRFFGLAIASDFIFLVSLPENRSLLLSIRNVGFMIDRLTYRQKRFLSPQINLYAFLPLKYAPIDIHISATNLQFPRLSPDGELRFQQQPDTSFLSTASFVIHNILRHLSFSARLRFFDKLHFMIGYDFSLRYNLAPIIYGGGLTGLTFGIKFSRKNVMFAYGHRFYYPGGGPHYFSISINMENAVKGWKRSTEKHKKNKK
ncbi:MAG: hypothetical protein GXO48_00130 [Chlorobi bacterium]|nr:hypothetical protein [Chlorobiota bacterium]